MINVSITIYVIFDQTEPCVCVIVISKYPALWKKLVLFSIHCHHRTDELRPILGSRAEAERSKAFASISTFSQKCTFL